MARRTKNQIETNLFMIDFFSMIQAAMQQQGISKTELAKRLKCSSANITQIFEKTDGCRIETLVSICKAISVTMSPEFIINTNQIIIKIEKRDTYPNKVYGVLKF